MKVEQIKDGINLPPLNQIVENILVSEIFLGFLALSIGGLLIYQIRNIFEKLFELYTRFGMFSVTVRSHEIDLYEQVIKWLNENEYSKKFRNIRIHTDIIDYDVGPSNQEFLYPGDGRYFAFYKGRILIINKSTNESKQLEPPEEIRLTVVTWSRKIARQMVDEIMALKPDADRVVIRLWDNGHWDSFGEREPRSLDTIYMEHEQQNQLLSDIQWFFDNKQWYKQRGIPYYRGYLFYGPPGTGKTTLAFALACYFKKRIYIMNLNSMRSDQELQDAFSQVRSNSIVAIEDVDVMLSAQARSENFTERPRENHRLTIDKYSQDDQKGITLSGLLNAMDGIASSENRITIMTTNDPASLDKALLRDGRVDQKIYLGYCTDEVKKQMFEGFFPEFAEFSNQFVNNYQEQYTPAELQGLFMRNVNDPQKLL